MHIAHNTAPSNKKKVCLFLITITLLISLPSQVFALTYFGTPQILDSTETVGWDTSLAMVNGMPAISYYDTTNDDLKFIRANNANSFSWGTPQTLDSTGNVGEYTSLAVVNGMPAISYYDSTNDDLKFIRATDANGFSWGTPQTLDSAGRVGGNTCLVVVDGNPAISYYDLDNYDLKFIRANDASGSSWGTPQTLDSTENVGWDTSLVVVEGYPAISYYDISNHDLKFIRATNASGSSWGTPQTLDYIGDVGRSTSLAVVNGNPAISYYNDTNHDLKFIRATNASGSSWGTPQTLDYIGDVGWTPSLAVVNGNPAISYFDITNDNLKFIRATDASGSSWGTPHTLDSTGNVGIYTSLAVVNGSPAISYYGNGTLKFIVVQLVDISVSNGATSIDNGGTLNFGTTTLNNPVTHTLTIQNNGDVTLDLTNLSLPAGFSFTGSFPTKISAGSSEDIQVRLDAIQNSIFSGNLLIGSKDTNLSPFSIALTGEVTQPAGEISVWDGASEILDDTSSIDFGSTVLNTPITRTFSIENSSPNDLDLGGLNLPIGFSLLGTYDTVVSNGASTTIQVRLDALSSGMYSGAFSLITDDSDENPFNFTLTGEVTQDSLETNLISPFENSIVISSPIRVSFNHDVLHDGSADAADNPINYLLVEDGWNGLFDTSTCLLGLAGDDVQVPISSVTYDDSNFTATINTDVLPSGKYQLLVCGTASIADLTGNVLNGGVFDSSTTFSVVSASSGAGTGGTVLLPATGFAPNQLTALPVQPAIAAYTDMDALRLQIPSLKVDVPIVGVPQTSNGWDVTWLTNGQAGWLNGSAYPTWEGNTVLTGHVTNASGNPGPFANIKTLKFGDEITIQAYGETYTYEVRENKLVTRDNLRMVNEHKDHDWITLITCEYFNESTGQYLYRRVVRAVLVEVE